MIPEAVLRGKRWNNPLLGTRVTCPLCQRDNVLIMPSDTNYAAAELEDHAMVHPTMLVRCPMAWAPVMPRCDGEHAEPTCGDPSCWHKGTPIAEALKP
jgi:hypothetical protein